MRSIKNPSAFLLRVLVYQRIEYNVSEFVFIPRGELEVRR